MIYTYIFFLYLMCLWIGEDKSFYTDVGGYLLKLIAMISLNYALSPRLCCKVLSSFFFFTIRVTQVSESMLKLVLTQLLKWP